jgi:transcriptional antiterminator RfaH
LSVEKVRRRKAEVVVEAMFPRYLFVQLDTSLQAKSWAPIRSTLGVSRLVHFGSTPAKVDDQLVELLRAREQAAPLQMMFEPGQSVTIVEGPFAGIEAIYQTTDAERRAHILLELLSNQVRLSIDPASLRAREIGAADGKP